MGNTIGWWSGGVTSAVACYLIAKRDIPFRVIMIDTKNEHPDTYRFKKDCENLYNKKIETISAIGGKYENIQDVWRKYKSLNVATGAVCSSELKRVVRENWQKSNNYIAQVFGFEFTKKEFNRAMSLKLNHPLTKPIFPLLESGLDKKDCLNILNKKNVLPPKAYFMGFKNNNCLATGCVQGGIGYWKKIKNDAPDLFNKMAKMEHELTDLKNEPVTMLKDQSIVAKRNKKNLVFLKKHPEYPDYKTIDDMRGTSIEPLMECNGLCGVNDLNKNSDTSKELNLSNN